MRINFNYRNKFERNNKRRNSPDVMISSEILNEASTEIVRKSSDVSRK